MKVVGGGIENKIVVFGPRPWELKFYGRGPNIIYCIFTLLLYEFVKYNFTDSKQSVKYVLYGHDKNYIQNSLRQVDSYLYIT